VVELSSLHAFVQVARDRSFSRAAQALFITQPAVSKRIAGLERELGTPLFDRVGRQVLLTEAGRQLLPRAEQLLDDMTDIRRELSNLSKQVAGTLLMGTSHHIGLHRLPRVLKGYTIRYPEVDLEIRFMSSELTCQAVERGELELGVVTLPPEPTGNLLLRPVWRDPLCFVVARDHPLARHPRLEAAELTAYPAVLPTASTYTRGLLEAALAPLGGEIRCELSTDYLETLKMMASIGLGWSLLPETLLDDGLVALEVTGVRLERRLGLVLNRQRSLSNPARAMLEQLQSSTSHKVV